MNRLEAHSDLFDVIFVQAQKVGMKLEKGDSQLSIVVSKRLMRLSIPGSFRWQKGVLGLHH